jgi:hypothetical protein
MHTYSLLNLIFLLTTSDNLLFFLFTSSLILNYSSVYIYEYFISFFCLSFIKLHLLSYFDYFSSHFQPFRMSHHLHLFSFTLAFSHDWAVPHKVPSAAVQTKVRSKVNNVWARIQRRYKEAGKISFREKISF